MDLTIVLAILGGIVIGLALATIRITAGLNTQELYYLSEFYKSLRAGAYECTDDERSVDDGD